MVLTSVATFYWVCHSFVLLEFPYESSLIAVNSVSHYHVWYVMTTDFLTGTNVTINIGSPQYSIVKSVIIRKFMIRKILYQKGIPNICYVTTLWFLAIISLKFCNFSSIFIDLYTSTSYLFINISFF